MMMSKLLIIFFMVFKLVPSNVEEFEMEMAMGHNKATVLFKKAENGGGSWVGAPKDNLKDQEEFDVTDNFIEVDGHKVDASEFFMKINKAHKWAKKRPAKIYTTEKFVKMGSGEGENYKEGEPVEFIEVEWRKDKKGFTVKIEDIFDGMVADLVVYWK